MAEEHDSVQLQIEASHHNLVAGTGERLWSRVGATNFKDAGSVITSLNLDPSQLEAGKKYRIADLKGNLIMDDAAIRAHIRKR
jgi:hypothetical protein